jgi:DedD protein
MASSAADTPRTPAPISPPRNSGRHVVALGTFGNPDNVARLLAAADKLGLATYTELTAGNLTRVRAGPFPTRQAANSALAKLKAGGLAGVLDRR